jgi:AcrR family transcriptional regulator
MPPRSRPYHHGDLRPALLRAAVETIDDAGPTAMSLREVARRAGVSHTAATYHFGDKAGLLTAVAVDGYRLLGEALAHARDAHGSFLDLGVAYVRFATTHRAHFDVMFRPDLYRRDDDDLREARARTAGLLYGTGESETRPLEVGVAAWAIVHGIATLWLDGNLPTELGNDPEEITHRLASHLRLDQRPSPP